MPLHVAWLSEVVSFSLESTEAGMPCSKVVLCVTIIRSCGMRSHMATLSPVTLHVFIPETNQPVLRLPLTSGAQSSLSGP